MAPIRTDPNGTVTFIAAPGLLAQQVGPARRAVRLAQTFVALGLPLPAREFPFHPLQRNRPLQLRMRFDLAWPDHRVALEIDGGVWTRGRHVRPDGFLRDHKKRNEAARYGWRILYATPEQADHAPGQLADMVSAALRWGRGEA